MFRKCIHLRQGTKFDNFILVFDSMDPIISSSVRTVINSNCFVLPVRVIFVLQHGGHKENINILIKNKKVNDLVTFMDKKEQILNVKRM
jgi:hypothetical protein